MDIATTRKKRKKRKEKQYEIFKGHRFKLFLRGIPGGNDKSCQFVLQLVYTEMCKNRRILFQIQSLLPFSEVNRWYVISTVIEPPN